MLMNDVKKIVEKLSKANSFTLSNVAETITGATVYRVKNSDNSTTILRYNLPELEFSLLINLTKILEAEHVLVPNIISFDKGSNSILMQDLGDVSLLDLLNQEGENSLLVKKHYKLALTNLLSFQVNAYKKINESKLIDINEYDYHLIKSDVDYFKDNFLVTKKLDSKTLKNIELELEELVTFLANIGCNFSYYRDCMTRNIMCFNGKSYFIDFVGGRPEFTGCFSAPLEASVVTLIQHIRANTSESFKKEMITFYLNEASNKFSLEIEEKDFMKNYYSYFLLKILQNLGTYSSLGVSKNNAKFFKMIPSTLKELKTLLISKKLGDSYNSLLALS